MMKRIATPLLVLIAALLIAGDWFMVSMSMTAASPVLGGDVITNEKLIYLTNAISFFVGVAVVMLFTLKLKDRYSDLKDELKRVEKHVNALSNEVQVPLSHGYAAREREKQATLGEQVQATHRDLRNYIAHLRRQAFVDPLTGARNKVDYLESVKPLAAQISTNMARFSLAVFDVDWVKQANNLGRENGDRLISDAADALRRVFGAEAVYRLGGDEFVGILENVGETQARRLFDALDAEVAEFNRRNPDRPVPLSIAKGAVTYAPGLYSSYEQMFHLAEDAMYRDQDATKARRGLEE